jgi:hypothetical protein
MKPDNCFLHHVYHLSVDIYNNSSRLCPLPTNALDKTVIFLNRPVSLTVHVRKELPLIYR